MTTDPLNLSHLSGLLEKATPGNLEQIGTRINCTLWAVGIVVDGKWADSTGNDRALWIALRNAAPDLIRLAREHEVRTEALEKIKSPPYEQGEVGRRGAL